MTLLVCPSCMSSFSQAPDAQPLILSCLHSVCKGCLHNKLDFKCPVQACDTPVPKQEVGSLPINYHLLGRALVRQASSTFPLEVSMSKPKCVRIRTPVYNSQNTMKGQNAMSQYSLTKMKEALIKLDEFINHIDELVRKECNDEAEFTEKVNSYVSKCHAQLDLKCEASKRDLSVISSGLCESNNLVDLVESLAIEKSKAHIVIDESIIDAIEKSVEIRARDQTYINDNDESPVSIIDVVDDSECENEDIDGEVEVEVCWSVGDGKCDDNFAHSQSGTIILDNHDCNVPVYDQNEKSSELVTVSTPCAPSASTLFEKMDAVEITWVNSPSEFYVMRLDDIPLLERLEYEMELIYEIGDDADIVVNVGDKVTVVDDETILRAEVLEILKEKTRVRYIDEGGEGIHNINELKVMPEELARIPGLAHRCCLTHIEPIEGGWSKLAAGLLAEVTEGTVCSLTVPDDTNPFSVNLYVEPSEGVSKDQKCCLSSYLVYKGLAKWTNGVIRPKSSNYQKGFLKLAPLREGSELFVMVSHIENPGLLYVQKIGEEGGYVQYVKTLAEDLMTTYLCRMNEKAMNVLVPMIGIACVAQMRNNQFQRAQVTKVFGDGLVEVQSIDYGNKEIIQDNKVFKILDRFLMLPVMATPVCLAGIGTTEGNEWSQEATNAFSKITWLKELFMCVNEEQTSLSPSKVMLYEMLEDMDVCVNARMVKEGHAISLSALSCIIESKKEVIQLECNKDVNERQVTDKKLAGKSGSKEVEKVPCHVVSVESPAKIYIRQVSDEDNFSQLIADIQDYYCGNVLAVEEAVVVPVVGELYAVYVDDKIGWARAKILDLKGKRVEVKLLDLGLNRTLDSSRLKNLDIKFRYKNFIDEVHLVNVLPVGGGDIWTRTACDKLKNFVDEFDNLVFVEMIGKSDKGKGSISVNLYFKVIESTEEEYILVSDKLVELGFAINTGAREEALDTKDFEEMGGISKKDLDNSVFTQWLRPLPAPNDEFLAVPSHVDWEGNIFICPMIPNQENVNKLRDVLDSKYQGSVYKPADKYWVVGQACVARWDLDGRWYRAQVLKIDYQEFTVLFVDYGTVEVVTVEDMRKDLLMTEMPIQCFPVQLENVVPVTEKWERSVLDFLHSIVVDQTVSVTITRSIEDTENNTKKYFAKIFTKTGLEIANLLITNGYARSVR